MLAEVVVGILAGSLALLSDAGHMLTDAAAIALSLVAARLAARPAEGAMTYGLGRAEILSAQANGITLLVLAVLITWEAVQRLGSPPQVDAAPVLVVALAGVAVNLLAARVLAGAGRESLNVEGSFRHVVTDLYAFIATALAAVVILATGFDRADAIASLFVAALMLHSAYVAAARVRADLPRGRARGHRRLGDRQRAGRRAPRRAGPRPARVGGDVRLPGAVGPRPRRARLRLPRGARAPGAPARRALRPRPTRRSRSSTRRRSELLEIQPRTAGER